MEDDGNAHPDVFRNYNLNIWVAEVDNLKGLTKYSYQSKE